MSQSTTGGVAAPASSTSTYRWRTVDIVVAAIIAVVFGVVFWAWGALWTATTGAFTFWPPLQAILYGVWFLPPVLAALVIRKPGAALFTEFVAALISALLGNQWGTTTIPYGLVEGAAVELAFLATMYRSFRLPTALLGALFGGISATLLDWIYYYPKLSYSSFKLPYGGFVILSCLLVAGLGGWLLARALAATGVLDRFASGRERELV